MQVRLRRRRLERESERERESAIPSTDLLSAGDALAKTVCDYLNILDCQERHTSAQLDKIEMEMERAYGFWKEARNKGADNKAI